MQTVEGGRATMRKREAKLSLEEYLDFFDNRDLDLTSTQLRQVIGLHGFKKMKFQKNLSIEMISTMDLMDLRRSTLLDDGVSGDASFALEEVIRDLKDLDWQECNVTSLLNQGAVVPPPAAAVAKKRNRGGGETASVKRKRGSETVPVKRKSGGETVSENRKSGGGTVSMKRKKLKSLKELEHNAIEVGVGNSTFRAGTPVAAGSTPGVLRSLTPVYAAGTPFAARSTTDILRSLASNSLAAVTSPPIISLLSGRQLRRLLKSNKCFIARSV